MATDEQSFPTVASPSLDESIERESAPQSPSLAAPKDPIERLEWEKERAEDRLVPRFLTTVVRAGLLLLILSALLIYLAIAGPINWREMISFPGTLGLVWFFVPLFVFLIDWSRRSGIRRFEDAIDKAKSERYNRRYYLETKIQDLQERHNAAVIWLLVTSVGLLIFEIYEVTSFRGNLNQTLRQIFPNSYVEMNSIVVVTPILWLLTVVIGVTTYYFWYRLPLKNARQKLAIDEEWQRRREERDPSARRVMLQEQLRLMTTTIASVFLDNAKRFELANRWRDRADDILEYLGRQRDDSPARKVKINLGDAETLIGQINELILREKNEVQQQKRWQRLAIVIMLVYIALPISVILLFPQVATGEQMVPVFGVPLSVIMWGAMGSLAAILYRFYNERERVRLDLELRWLIARPIIGLIMGGLAYLAIVSGLALLNTGGAIEPGSSGEGSLPTNLNVFWVIAFLAGFSDKFYVGFIKLLVGRTLGESEKQEPTKSPTEPATEDAIPEAMKEEIFPTMSKKRTNSPRGTKGSSGGAKSSGRGPKKKRVAR